jgi:hypothetical protein
MKVREKGLLIVWTPFCELYHYEMKSRGIDDTREKIAQRVQEATIFKNRWHVHFKDGDPYYMPISI